MQYVIAEPSQGQLYWLDQVVYLNGMKIFPAEVTRDMFASRPDFLVVRWTNADANIAERIALRELERLAGGSPTPEQLSAIQALVQAEAADGCGVFSARLVKGDPSEFGGIVDFKDTGWVWQAWAMFVWAFLRLPTQLQRQWFQQVQSHDCQWAPMVSTLNQDVPSYVMTDPWYAGYNVWKLPASAPFVFDQAPPGYDGPFTAPPAEGMPPVPGTTPQTPPGTTTPETPPASTPPGTTTPPGPATPPPGPTTPAVPVTYAGEKKKASGWQLAGAALIGLTGIGLLVATVAMPKR